MPDEPRLARWTSGPFPDRRVAADGSPRPHGCRARSPGRAATSRPLREDATLDLRTLVRSIQVFFPFAQEARFGAHRLWQRWTGRPSEPDLLALPLLDLPTDALLLDVGANRGLVLEAMLRLLPASRVVAFEPNPRLAAALAARHAGNPRVEVRALGLGERAERATLWLPIYRDWAFDGLASLDPEAAASWLAQGRLYGFRRAWLRLEPLAIETVRLDDLDLAPAFVKLDVQGHELAVLRGGEATLRRHRPVLLIEAGDPAVAAWLDRLDYRSAAFEGGRLRLGRSGRVNSFFLPEEKAGRLAAGEAG